MRIIWRDTFTITENTLSTAIEEIRLKTGIATSYGKKVFEDKDYIILEQNFFNRLSKHNDYIVIPKKTIVKVK